MTAKQQHQVVRDGRRLVVLVCGARDWTQRAVIKEWLAKLHPGSIVVHGGCGKRDDKGVAIEGADLIAADVARELGLEVRAYPVDHALDGPWPGAGPRRNQRQLDAEQPDVVLAFTYALRKPGNQPTGTGDMCLRAVEAGVRVTIIPPKRLEAQSLLAKAGEP